VRALDLCAGMLMTLKKILYQESYAGVPMASDVFLTKVVSDEIYPALFRLVSKLRIPESPKPIGIKVNLCDYRKRETGVTTDPMVLDPLLSILRALFPSRRIYMFENDATGMLADNIFTWLGLDKIAAKYDIDFVNLAHETWETIGVNGYKFKEIEVPRRLLNSTIINHPKLKTHGRTKMTCSLKNMYGCYRIKDKVRYHTFLDKAIADINIPIKTDYIIVDAFLCVEGNRGPTQGYPKRVGAFIGGTDVVAVDAFCAKFMGFNPKSIKHILLAANRGVGSMDYKADSELSPKECKDLRFQFNLSKYWLMQLLRKAI